MEEVHINATFDTPATAALAAQSINSWFAWMAKGSPEEAPEPFEDFGLAREDYPLEDGDAVAWDDIAEAGASGGCVCLCWSGPLGAVDTLQELLEALGAYDVRIGNEEEEDES
ncbi:MAG: hypothetical protein AAF471_07010 [Myxococcota bacterium]